MTDEEMNKLITEKVFGECWHENGANIAGYYHCPKCACIVPLKYSTSTEGLNIDYRSDLNAAMKFADKLIAEGWEFDLNRYRNAAGWWATFTNRGSHAAYDKTNPALAICKAGTGALGLQPDTPPTTAGAAQPNVSGDMKLNED